MVVTIKIIANIGVMISRLLRSNERKSIYLQIQNPKAFSNGELFSRAIFEPFQISKNFSLHMLNAEFCQNVGKIPKVSCLGVRLFIIVPSP